MPVNSYGPTKNFPCFSGLVYQTFNVVSIATAGNVTYTTDQLLGGYIRRDTNGGARTDTLPTAAQLVAAIEGAVVGTGINFFITNTAGAANTLTVAGGTGGTTSGTMTIAQSNSKEFLLVINNITPGSEAYTLYSLGTSTT